MPLALSLPPTGVPGAPLGLPTDGLLGAPPTVLSLTGVSGGPVGDEGGWEITAEGVFPTTQGVLFRLQDGGDVDDLCYSGQVGQGEYAVSEDAATCDFVTVPVPPGTYDLYAETEDGLYSATLAAAIVVIEGSYETNLYSLRACLPPPRDVGPYDLRDEE